MRFFHAGEYGERHGRPHYHALIFGYDFADRVPYQKNESGSMIYVSETLSRLWSNGFASVGDVTFESAAYVARYCLKKVSGKGKEEEGAGGLKPYERLDLATGTVWSVRPEYCTMSRRPGIGKSWYTKYRSDVYPAGVRVLRGGIKTAPPRYYDGLYELEFPLDMKRIKLHRMSSSVRKEAVWNDVLQKVQELPVFRQDRLDVQEECKLAQVRLLKRKVDSGYE